MCNCNEYQMDPNLRWRNFLTEFILRAMARPDVGHYNYSVKNAVLMAQQAWDAIQEAEDPESLKEINKRNEEFISLLMKGNS